MKKNTFSIPILICAFILLGLGNAIAQTYDISSGGLPTITGITNGSVTGSSSVLNNLSVTVNFGEISPSNRNSIVKVVVPIAIRSLGAYQVTASISGGAANANAQALQQTDFGFGVSNLRSLGSGAKVCGLGSHTFSSPFNNDPANNVTLNASGRAAYPSTLANISGSTIIVQGPQLSNGLITLSRATNNGYAFDAVVVVTPQYYATSSFSATLTFTIGSSGLGLPCL